MDDIILARIIHMVSVLFWIGGVGFVTLVVMPSIRAEYRPGERIAAFHQVEGRFAGQARAWVLLAGASGMWMAWRGDMWSRFADPRFWWMHAMVLVWLLFATMLFIIEPLFLHRHMGTAPDPARLFARMERMHRVLLILSIIAFIGAIGGSHGLF